MAVISFVHRYLFLHAPNTGGTAVSHVLRSELNGQDLPSERIETTTKTGNTKFVGQHITLAQLTSAGLLTVEERSNLLVFATVRNPFDALYSVYVKQRTRPSAPWREQPLAKARAELAQRVSFPEFVETFLAGTPPRYRTEHLCDADLVVRFESLQHDFDDVLQHLGVARRVEIPRINATEHRSGDYRPHYTAGARAAVERAYAPDFDRFGYSF